MRIPDEVPHPADRSAPSARDVGVSRLLVGAQFVLLALLVLLPSGGQWRVPPWLVALAAAAGLGGLVVIGIAAAALGPGLTPSPLPNARAHLKTDGVYAYVRHPIYSGLLLVAAAIAAVSGSVVRLAVFAALAVLLHVKARWEERRLTLRFPGYAAYAARTPRFVPRLVGRRPG